MDVSKLTDLGNLPFSTLSAGVLWQILGPSAKYLGGKTQELTQQSVENIERIFDEAWKRLSESSKTTEGQVPPRVLKATIAEGAFTEDAVSAAYLGGVLASSKVNFSRDDRGVCINALISRLSVYQIRLHYVIYTAIHRLYQGTSGYSWGETGCAAAVYFDKLGRICSMGLVRDLELDPEFNLMSVLGHTLYGLDKEGLIVDWGFEPEGGFNCSPTPLGAELFLWANGQGKESLDYFFHKHFVPIRCEVENLEIISENAMNIELDNGSSVAIPGFDYRFQEEHCVCKVEW